MALRSLAATVALLGASLLAVLLTLELSLRGLYPPPTRFLYPQESYDFDPELGYTLRPGQLAFTHDRPVRTNALGLRDSEIAPASSVGTLRILALGDSQTFGNGLDLADTWPKQLERDLPDGSGHRWVVVNAGIPGTDTWQHEIFLRRLLVAIHPAEVVLGLYVNDVVPRSDPRHARASEQTNSLEKRIAYAFKRSAVVTWVYNRLVQRWYARRFKGGTPAEEDVLAGTRSDVAERGWHQVEQSLFAMKALCDAHGAVFLVAILPRRDQIAGSHHGRAYQDRALAVATSLGIEAIDLLPDLSAAYRLKRDSLFIPWDGHNSAAANQVIARHLATRVSNLTTRDDLRRSTPASHGNGHPPGLPRARQPAS